MRHQEAGKIREVEYRYGDGKNRAWKKLSLKYTYNKKGLLSGVKGTKYDGSAAGANERAIKYYNDGKVKSERVQFWENSPSGVVEDTTTVTKYTYEKRKVTEDISFKNYETGSKARKSTLVSTYDKNGNLKKTTLKYKGEDFTTTVKYSNTYNSKNQLTKVVRKSDDTTDTFKYKYDSKTGCVKQEIRDYKELVDEKYVYSKFVSID